MAHKTPKKVERPGVDGMGRTELHYAALDADLPRVQALLLAGSDPNAGDDNGFTPLHFSAQSNILSVSEILLQAGAEVDLIDAHGNTPLFKAVFNSDGGGELIKLLLGAGADRNKENNYGVSPLVLAKTIANYDLVQFFS